MPRARGSGFPRADTVQPAPLLAGSSRIQAPAACDKPISNHSAVRHRLMVVVLELGPHLRDLQAQTANTGQHPTVGRLADDDVSRIAVRLEVVHLAAQQFSLPLGVVDDVGPADELNGRIVAGGNPLLRRGSCRGTPRAGHKGIITDDSDDNVGVAFKRRPDRVSASKVDQ